MRIYDHAVEIPAPHLGGEIFEQLRQHLTRELGPKRIPLRLAVTRMGAANWACEVGVTEGEGSDRLDDMFRFTPRKRAAAERFNAVLIVPTGVGAEVGGHSGDAGAVARLMGAVCDTLVTHPNVMNAADINEMPENSLYVEGSLLTRLMMGAIALQPARANRVLIVLDQHPNHLILSAYINAANAARAASGLLCPRILTIEPPLEMRANYTAAGRASGEIIDLQHLLSALEGRRDSYDAIAIATHVDVPGDIQQDYFDGRGNLVNPWGGVEALLTHAISGYLNVPSAHAPMWEGQLRNIGVVDPRIAAEAISITAFQSVLKGLQRSPAIVAPNEARGDAIGAGDLSCLVIPNGCLGLPTLAAFYQGIPVIEVRENQNLMENDLSALPWAEGQFYSVANYWEAAGLVAAMRAGVSPETVRRPIEVAPVEKVVLKRRS